MDHRPQKGKESKGADQQAQRLEQEPKIIPRPWSLVEFASMDLNSFRAQWDFSGGSVVKNLPAMRDTQESQVWSLGWEDLLEEGMATTPVFLPGEPHEQRGLVG